MKMNSFSGKDWEVPQLVKLTPDVGNFNVEPGRELKTSLSANVRKSDQLLWITDHASEDGFGVIEGTSFEEVSAWKEGREESIQGVFFGYLALGQELEVPVAVKPFLSAIGAGAHETVMLMDLQAKGLPVYEVLGVSWTGTQGFSLITRFEEESRSLDNVNWRKGMETPLGEHLTNLEAIEQIGQSLGLLHGNGIIHRDAQIKNFAVNGDQVKLIDLAQARTVVSEDSQVDEIGLRVGMFKDLNMLLDSLREKKFLGDATAEQLASFIENVIAPAYRSGLFRAHGIIEREVANYRVLVEEIVADIVEQYR